MSKPTRPQIQRVIDHLINRRDNNAIPAGVSLGDFDTTIATLRNFIIGDRLRVRDEVRALEADADREMGIERHWK